jgi:hypothetical protein
MTSLPELVPDPNLLLGLELSELAWQVLEVARTRVSNGGVIQAAILNDTFESEHEPHLRRHPRSFQPQIEFAVEEAWAWLEVNLLLIPTPGGNGQNGWRTFSRSAAGLSRHDDFKSFVNAAAFPKTLLHNSISDRVWVELASGHYDVAAFTRLNRSKRQCVRRGSMVPKK